MPKGRMLNKKISYDEKIAKLSIESTLLFVFFIPHLDVSGRFFAKSEIIKGTICPYIAELTPRKIQKCLKEMEEMGLIMIYGDGEHKYLQFNGFVKNQKIDKNKEAQSEIPDPNSRVTPE